MNIDMTADVPVPDASDPSALINHAHSIDYWHSVSADTSGMLGGFPQTSRIDLQSSANFLTKLRRAKSTLPPKQPLPLLDRVVDCGAGVGRITRAFLLKVGRRVDVVEPLEKFTDELVRSLGAGDGERRASNEWGQVGQVINLGLQDWVPEDSVYDVIWNQWCLGYLTDVQLVAYLQRCKKGIKKAGGGAQAWVIVKENLSTDSQGKDVYDEEDSSVTRSDEKFRQLFKEAGLRIVATELQKGFPKILYPVRIYALKPE